MRRVDAAASFWMILRIQKSDVLMARPSRAASSPRLRKASSLPARSTRFCRVQYKKRR